MSGSFDHPVPIGLNAMLCCVVSYIKTHTLKKYKNWLDTFRIYLEQQSTKRIIHNRYSMKQFMFAAVITILIMLFNVLAIFAVFAVC